MSDKLKNSEIALLMKMLPDDIRDLIAENGELARLTRQTSRLLDKGQPDFITDDDWLKMQSNYEAMLSYSDELDQKIQSALLDHRRELEVLFPHLKA